ncbi:MAG: Hpt domain-containing protein [Bacteroidales bacterium]
MEPDTNLIDLSFLKKLTDGKPEKMKYYISMHLKTSPGLFDQLVSSFDDLSYEEIFSRAHSLKPQCDYVGIIGLKEQLIEIENASRKKLNRGDLFHLVQKAVDINNKGMAELRSYIDQ